ncbi:sugar ABC transporter substrate-binding protein [Streptomyces sp. NBC_00063]|uniref:sugar ABC transporter substrate-binding protein n=1 Tax=Streptomyces sp. NBC_00063 TaxID=2975638 RepID=UPI003D758569
MNVRTRPPATSPRSRRCIAAFAAVGALMSVAACGSSDSGSGDAGGGTYTFWDPYPQFAAGSAWEKTVKDCGSKAGVKVKRTAMDTTDVANKALLAAQQSNTPDVLVVDNPVVSTLVEAGILTKAKEAGLDTAAHDKNLLGAGTVDGDAYGVPIGANTLALYYNADVLKAAGVDPASVKDWATLTQALAKVKKAGKKGITFSGIKTEEGSFQFLPWFWGAGADLRDLGSAEAVSALSLWKGWLDKGYAPNSVINNTQTTSWQEFASGDYAFAENGTWQLANAKKAGFKYGVVTIPAKDGGQAAAPTGGEFVTVPVQKDSGRYATSKKIVDCLTDSKNLLATDTTLSYVASTTAVQEQQAKQDPALKPWVSAVRAAKGRTSDGLGTKYPVISEQLWTAVQAALSGAQSPGDALAAAQKAAAAKTDK